jgi:hypothetical protein
MEKTRDFENMKTGFFAVDNQGFFSAAPMWMVLVLYGLFSATSCVKKPEIQLEKDNRLALELAIMDSIMDQEEVKSYAKTKTILRIAVNESVGGGSNFKAISTIAKNLVKLIDEPSIGVFGNNPVIWLDAILEWEVANSSINRMNEDDYPTILESVGEADFFFSSTGARWTNSWEHLLLSLVWQKGEKNNLAIYEMSKVVPEELGNNEVAVIAMWIVYLKFVDWGFPKFAEYYIVSANDLLNSNQFKASNRLRVSWLPGSRERLREELIEMTEIIQLAVKVNDLGNYSKSDKDYVKLKGILDNRPVAQYSEIHVVADFLMSQMIPEHQLKKEPSAMMKIAVANNKNKGQLVNILFGAYLVSWLWENGLDKQVMNGQYDLPKRIFKLTNTLENVRSFF